MPEDEPDEWAEEADDSSSDEGGEDEEDRDEEREAEDTDRSAMTTGVPGRGGEKEEKREVPVALVVTAGLLVNDSPDDWTEPSRDSLTRDCPRPPVAARGGGVAGAELEEVEGVTAAEGPGARDEEGREDDGRGEEEEEGKGEGSGGSGAGRVGSIAGRDVSQVEGCEAERKKCGR